MAVTTPTNSPVVLMLLFATLVPCTIFAQPADHIIYDEYHWGVHTAELSVSGSGDSALYELRRRDVFTNTWQDPVTAAAAKPAGNETIHLSGAIARFPAQLAELANIDWSAARAIGWPDESSIYVRHRQITEQVNGHPVTASYWGLRDASVPMDLVVGVDNTIIAAIDVQRDWVVVRRGFERFTTVGEWQDSSVSQPLYTIQELEMAMVRTSSGSSLATRVYLPDGVIEGPFPAIFVRTPYGITNLIDKYWQYVVRGYAVVLQAVRGTAYWDPESRSEGVWDSMIQEPPDGADGLTWIVEQPWSNGKVCMQGGSYRGYTQWSVTMARNPSLKCLVPEVSMGTAFSDQPYMGGTLVQGVAVYDFWMLDKTILTGRSWTDIFRHRPLADIDVYATGENLPLWNMLFDHWRNDELWKMQDWYESDHERNFGTLQISGWFDDDYPGTRSNWALMATRGTRPNRLILGPWKHGYNVDRMLNGYSFGINALRDDIWLIKQKWYDYFLKGVENGVADPTVEYFVMGENAWRTADAWPPDEVTAERFYFHSTARANSHPAVGRLTPEAPTTDEPPEVYKYDPKDPVTNWYSFDLMESWADVQSFPYDFKDIELRHDLATYTTEPLDEDLTLAGNINIVLYASTDVKDTDWWVHLSDVTPSNESNRLTVGVLRARFRNLDDTEYHVFGSNFETEVLLSANIDEVVRYEIAIPSVANTFKKGHRIRIAVMNALDNYSFPNSNTGGDEGYVTETVIGNMQIHHSNEYPSHVILPVLAK